MKFGKRMLKTLPIAWFFYGVAYALVPWAEEALRSWLLGGTAFLPLAGLTVAAASISARFRGAPRSRAEASRRAT